MTIDAYLDGSQDETRAALHAAFRDARAAGDTAEMARLQTLAGELDALRRKQALGALADGADAVEAIRTGLNDGRGGGTGLPDLPGKGGPAEPVAQQDVSTVAVAPMTGPLAWGAVTRRKHGDAFNDRVRDIANGLGCDASCLMAVMAFETAESFSPAIRNAAGSGATGLIQFMPATARRLGTSTPQLARMSALAQLDYVEAYFRSATRKPLRTLSDIYMAVLWPAAVGKAESHVLFRDPGRAYALNRGFDVNRDGVITKAEAAAKVHQKLIKGMKEGRIG